jgi:hypothetical protein
MFHPALNGGSSISSESLKGLLVKIRWIMWLETGNTMMIKSTIAAMLSAMSNYQVQLVILEPNETLDSDEIKFGSLTKLKLMYPLHVTIFYQNQLSLNINLRKQTPFSIGLCNSWFWCDFWYHDANGSRSEVRRNRKCGCNWACK